MRAASRTLVVAMCAVLLVSAGLIGFAGAQTAKTVSVNAQDDITAGNTDGSATLVAQNVEDADGAGSYEVEITYNDSAVSVDVSDTSTYQVSTSESTSGNTVTLTVVGYTDRTQGPTGDVTLANLDVTANSANDGTDVGVTVEEISDTKGNLLAHSGATESIVVSRSDDGDGATPTPTPTPGDGDDGEDDEDNDRNNRNNRNNDDDDDDDGDDGDDGDGVSASVEGDATVDASFDGEATSLSVSGTDSGDSVQLTFSRNAVSQDLSTGAAVNGMTISFGSTTDFDAQVSYDETNPSSTVPDLDADTGAETFGYLNVDHGASDGSVSGVTFNFTVTQDRLDRSGLDAEQVSLYRYEDDEWTEYDATVVSERNGQVTYTADVPGLSVFAIGQHSEQVTTTEPTTTTTEPETATPEPTTTTPEPTTTTETETSTGTPGFGPVVAVIAVLAAALVAVRRD